MKAVKELLARDKARDCLALEVQLVYRSIPRKRPWALNPSKLNQGGVGAYPG